MSDVHMPVKSRLKIILSEFNTDRVRRGEEPLTIRALASEMKLSPSVITGLNTGRASRVDFDTLGKLCARLNVQPGDILVYTPE